MKELTHEEEILITEANKEKKIQEEIEEEELNDTKASSYIPVSNER